MWSSCEGESEKSAVSLLEARAEHTNNKAITTILTTNPASNGLKVIIAASVDVRSVTPIV
jgi:hypothetical protein